MRPLLLFVLVSAASAQTPPAWTEQFPQDSPPKRSAAAMAYDVAEGQTILFGGNGLGILGDTWTWDGSNWTQAAPQSSPSPRESHAMVYDDAHHQIVLFGGFDGNSSLNDTWIWDGSNWIQEFPQTSPPPRNSFAMAYDSTRSQVVLFGGASGFNVSNDTWVWDGSNWAQQFPLTSPPARSNSAMAFDSAHGQAVLFAGFPNGPHFLGDTWVWDGSNWTEESPQATPPAREYHALAFDSAHGQVVLFGGQSSTTLLNDTWVWDGSNWTAEPPLAALIKRIGHSMTYDSVHNQVVLFGGSNGRLLADTWTWFGGAPKVTPPPPPPPPPAVGPTISGAVSASAFGGFSTVAPGSWVEIYGSNLAPDTGSWTGADFSGNNAPTMLEGVSVSIGGQAAFVDYISAGQVNAQLPSDISPGGVLQLTITNGSTTSAPINLTVNATAPGLLAPTSFKVGPDQYVVAQLPDGNYVLPEGAISGVSSRPAQPGEIIVIYGVGFGSVTPNIPAGQIVTEESQLTATLDILFGTTPAQLRYFGLAPNLVGLVSVQCGCSSSAGQRSCASHVQARRCRWNADAIYGSAPLAVFTAAFTSSIICRVFSRTNPTNASRETSGSPNA